MCSRLFQANWWRLEAAENVCAVGGSVLLKCCSSQPGLVDHNQPQCTQMVIMHALLPKCILLTACANPDEQTSQAPRGRQTRKVGAICRYPLQVTLKHTIVQGIHRCRLSQSVKAFAPKAPLLNQNCYGVQQVLSVHPATSTSTAAADVQQNNLTHHHSVRLFASGPA